MQVFFILFSVHFAVYQYINSKCLYRTHVKIVNCQKIFEQYLKIFVEYKGFCSFLSSIIVCFCVQAVFLVHEKQVIIMQCLLCNNSYVTNVAQKYGFYFTYANKRRSFCQETTSFLIIVLLLLKIKYFLHELNHQCPLKILEQFFELLKISQLRAKFVRTDLIL